MVSIVRGRIEETLPTLVPPGKKRGVNFVVIVKLEGEKGGSA